VGKERLPFSDEHSQSFLFLRRFPEASAMNFISNQAKDFRKNYCHAITRPVFWDSQAKVSRILARVGKRNPPFEGDELPLEFAARKVKRDVAIPEVGERACWRNFAPLRSLRCWRNMGGK
jgi:hypothetical protein